MKYRRKTCDIEARQWDGTVKSAEEICHWANDLDNCPDKHPDNCIASFDEMMGAVTRFDLISGLRRRIISKSYYVCKFPTGEFRVIPQPWFESEYEIDPDS